MVDVSVVELKEIEGISNFTMKRANNSWNGIVFQKKFNISNFQESVSTDQRVIVQFVHFHPDIYMNKIERSEIRHNKLKPENVIEIQIRFRLINYNWAIVIIHAENLTCIIRNYKIHKNIYL